jgi:N-acetylneuraminic acid mutarotase
MEVKTKMKKKKLYLLSIILVATIVFVTISSSIVVRADVPAIRFGTTMCYDIESSRIVLYGGLKGGLAPEPSITWWRDTWTYDSGCNIWEKQTIDSVPEQAATYIVYDSESDKAIIYGGSISDTWTNDMVDSTYAFDLNTQIWEEMEPSYSPERRKDHAMVYDSESDLVVLFGGLGRDAGEPTTTIDLGDTWTYDYNSDSWSHKYPSTSPDARFLHNMAYDSESDKIILFGGAIGLSAGYDDTWAYDTNTNTWENMNPSTHPPNTMWHGMVYDSESDKIILHGGNGANAPKTWTYDYNTNTWEYQGLGPSRLIHGMAYDNASDCVVVYGGGTPGLSVDDLNLDTWLYFYNNNTWKKAPTEPYCTDPSPMTLYPVLVSISFLAIYVLFRKKK